MKRVFMTALVLVMLLTQWGSLGHDYHIHDAGESCDYCLGAHAFDHGVMHSTELHFNPSFSPFQLQTISDVVSENGFYHYAVRAPPRFI